MEYFRRRSKIREIKSIIKRSSYELESDIPYLDRYRYIQIKKGLDKAKKMAKEEEIALPEEHAKLHRAARIGILKEDFRNALFWNLETKTDEQLLNHYQKLKIRAQNLEMDLDEFGDYRGEFKNRFVEENYNHALRCLNNAEKALREAKKYICPAPTSHKDFLVHATISLEDVIPNLENVFGFLENLGDEVGNKYKIKTPTISINLDNIDRSVKLVDGASVTFGDHIDSIRHEALQLEMILTNPG